MADVYVSCSDSLDVESLIRVLAVDSDGDSYFDCNNTELSLEDLLRLLIVEDDDGNPALSVYGCGGGGGGGGHMEFTSTAGQTVFDTGGTLTLDANYKVFVDGSFQSWGHTRVGNVVTFTHSFAEGHEISIHE
jgi:hypothetical protein